MKNTMLATICLLALALNSKGQTTNPAPYCEAKIIAITTMFDNHIKQVTIGALSNNTGAVSFTGSEYVYYNNLSPVSLQKGVTIPVTITVSKNDMEMNALWVYIDYNLNNAFEQTELVGQASSTILSNAAFGNVNLSFNINIPTSALQGQTRMRFIYTSDMMLGTPSTPMPCNSTTSMSQPALYYGEIEDYNITITNQSVGINEYEKDGLIKMNFYPNPASSYFNLESLAVGKSSVYNLAGEKLLDFDIAIGKQILDMSSYPKGIYMLIVQQGEKQQTLKLIKD